MKTLHILLAAFIKTDEKFYV